MSVDQPGTDFILSPYPELSYSTCDRIKSVPYGSNLYIRIKALKPLRGFVLGGQI